MCCNQPRNFRCPGSGQAVVFCALSIMLIYLSSIAGSAELYFNDMPPGWRIVKSFNVPRNQVVAIGKKLGAPINHLSNTLIAIQGQQIRVNILRAATKDGAIVIHKAIARIKSHPAFCLRQGKIVIEFVGGNVALATKVAYELGFTNKPKQVHYQVIADVATVEKCDYMSANRIFQLFLAAKQSPSSNNTAKRIALLTKRFTFGKSIVVRTCAEKSTAPIYQWKPAGYKKHMLPGSEAIAYSFAKTLRISNIPYVILTAQITTNTTSVTPTTRRGEGLLGSTRFWPVDDPAIRSLAGRITHNASGTKDKVKAILVWLTPGRNIKFGGSVTGSRWGVKKVLQQKFGRCWDFSDCFVTLCRAANIPCRQVGGWVYGAGGHIWAEVLIAGKEWWQVDPTGGNKVKCGIYHIPYFITEDGKMPILYVSMPRIAIITAK